MLAFAGVSASERPCFGRHDLGGAQVPERVDGASFVDGVWHRRDVDRVVATSVSSRVRMVLVFVKWISG